MKLQDQIVSLELAREMKELGFPQESLFWWISPRQTESYIDYASYGTRFKKEISCSAYTVAELGNMIPERIENFKAFQMGKYNDNWVIKYEGIESELNVIRFQEKTEADLRAKLVIDLKKEKLIK